MTSFSRVGVIGALMVAVGCGGELSLDPDIQPVPAPPTKSVPNNPRPTPDPPGAAGSSPITDASLYPAVTDVASDDAKKVCSMRANAARERKLGTFTSQGWTGLENATGVDALFYEGGSSTGGPITYHSGLQLAFPVPTVIDAVTGTSTSEEKIYQLRWTWTSGKAPADLFQPGTTYDVYFADDSWGYRCSSKGGDMADNWNDGDAKVTITARTPERVDGIVERKGTAGIQTLTFSAPTTGTYATSTIASEGVCCLGKY